MPVNVYVFLVTTAGLLTTRSLLGSVPGLESLGCRTGPVFLDNVSGPEWFGSNAEFETFGIDTGLEIFGTGLESLGTGIGLLEHVSWPALFDKLTELRTSGTVTGLMFLGTGLESLGAVMGLVVLSFGVGLAETGLSVLETGVRLEHLKSVLALQTGWWTARSGTELGLFGESTEVEPSSVLTDWLGGFIVWDTLMLFTWETSETTLSLSSTVCNSEYWKPLDDVTTTEDLFDMSAEQPSSSMWSSNGRGVHEGVVQMEGTGVFSNSVLGSVDGIVAAWSTGKLENSTESWLTDNWEPDWMFFFLECKDHTGRKTRQTVAEKRERDFEKMQMRVFLHAKRSRSLWQL